MTADFYNQLIEFVTLAYSSENYCTLSQDEREAINRLQKLANEHMHEFNL